jgi:hypothetical protein
MVRNILHTAKSSQKNIDLLSNGPENHPFLSLFQHKNWEKRPWDKIYLFPLDGTAGFRTETYFIIIKQRFFL